MTQPGSLLADAMARLERCGICETKKSMPGKCWCADCKSRAIREPIKRTAAELRVMRSEMARRIKF